MPEPDRSEAADSRRPRDPEVEAVLDACRVLVAITARSMAATSDVTDLLHLRALVVLASGPPLSLGALAQAVGIHLTRASRLCDRLVARGFVDRTDDPDNRRQLLLRLTPAGREVVDEVMHGRAEQIRPILARMDADDRRSLVTALREFARAAGGLAAADLYALGWGG
ncbi:MarR family winged helix-turn-helix transcriptional regulator [Terrabacter sp. 2YAF2]|uniref:MarR family winged helix-turn-helix transcriptional regulator n=1 Tax=Terrabacter sp. 2YAF2 TaxID=3233026 RepID=UPI003F963559